MDMPNRSTLATVLDVMGGEWDTDELIRLAVVVDTLSTARLCREVEDAIRASAEAYASDCDYGGDEMDAVLKRAPYDSEREALRGLAAAVTVDSDIAMCSVAYTYLEALEAASED
jgi:hypothetical protein